MSQPDREQAVGRAFVAMADTMVDDYDVIDMLDQLATQSVALLAADAAGILLPITAGHRIRPTSGTPHAPVGRVVNYPFVQ